MCDVIYRRSPLCVLMKKRIKEVWCWANQTRMNWSVGFFCCALSDRRGTLTVRTDNGWTDRYRNISYIYWRNRLKVREWEEKKNRYNLLKKARTLFWRYFSKIRNTKTSSRDKNIEKICQKRFTRFLSKRAKCVHILCVCVCVCVCLRKREICGVPKIWVAIDKTVQYWELKVVFRFWFEIITRINRSSYF